MMKFALVTVLGGFPSLIQLEKNHMAIVKLLVMLVSL